MGFKGPKARWVLLFTCILVPWLYAASPASSLSEYLFQVWQTDQGLPEDSATAMVQTPDGYLWFGTFNGLVRFDGVKFTVFDRSNTPELPSPGIVNLYLDRSGRLWVSTLLGTAYVKDGHWRVFHESDGWVGNYVWRFAESPSGELYFTTFDHKLLRFRGDRFEEIAAPPESRPELGFQTYIDEAGSLWVINATFIGRWADGKWQKMMSAASLLRNDRSDPLRPMLMAAAARDGGLWIATGRTLRKYRARRLVFETSAPWTMESLWSLHEDSAGGVWIPSSAAGLYHFSIARGWQHFTAESTLPYHAVRFVFEDRKHNLWVGTSGGGLERFKQRYLFEWGVKQGLPERVIKSVTADARGTMYFATWGKGIARLQGARITPLLRPHDRTFASPNGICGKFFDGLAISTLADSKGRLWVSTYSDGLFLLEGRTCRGFFASAGNSPLFDSLFEDSHGRIWGGTQGGAFVFDGTRFKKFPFQDVPVSSSVRSMAEDTRNRILWAGNEAGGLYRFDGARFVPVPEAHEISNEWISSLLVDPDGTLWIGTEDGGIACLRHGHLTRISTPQGLPTRSISSILDDGIGNLWFGSNRGILRASRKQLEELINRQTNRIEFQVFNQSDGMATAECSMAAQQSAVKDHAGRLWFATLRGAVMIDPKTLRLNTQPPPLAIEQILLDDRPIAVRPAFVTSAAAPPISVTVPPGDHRLEIHYAALSFTAPEKVRFRSMLEGFDKTWIDVGDRRVAYVQHMRPGTYRFRLMAANNDGVWNEAGISSKLDFRPHFYETYWFYGLCILGALLLGAGFHRRRLLRLEARALELTQLVNNRTGELTKQHAFLQQILDINPNFIFAKDREGRFTLVNRALADRFHAKPDDLIGKTDADLEPRRRETEALGHDDLDVMNRLEEKVIPEEPVIDAEGELHWLQVVKRPIIGEDGRAHQVLGVATDITERKRTEEELRQYREHLEEEVARRTVEIREANAQLRQQIMERQNLEEQLRQAQKMEAIGTLSGGIAHDFNNLLTVIQGYAGMLVERLRDDQGLRRYVEQISQAGERAASLTRQLLAFSRRQVLQPKVLNLNALVLHLEKMLQRLIGEDIEMVVIPAPGLGSLKADPGQLEQVIMNLVVNARDAMPNGGKLTLETANVELDEAYAREHVSVRPGHYVMLAVSDSGMGMDQQTLSHMFEPFFTTKEQGRGTGLGLSMVYGIVKQSEGHIWVYSEPGRGTTFKIYLPLVAEGAEALPLAETLSVATDGVGTILLVEDNHPVRELASSVLATSGYTVLPAESTQLALSICQEHPGAIDLLLTDIVMPGFSGRELAKRISARRPNIKILYMSGYTTSAIVHQGVLDPGTFFLQKPFTPSSLKNKVREALSSPPLRPGAASRSAA
jgi:PAS domain S-box-containing protein